MTKAEKHKLGIELCRMPGCESCAYHRKRLTEAVEQAKRKNTRGAGTTAAVAASKSKGDDGASLGPRGVGRDLS